CLYGARNHTEMRRMWAHRGRHTDGNADGKRKLRGCTPDGTRAVLSCAVVGGGIRRPAHQGDLVPLRYILTEPSGQVREQRSPDRASSAPHIAGGHLGELLTCGDLHGAGEVRRVFVLRSVNHRIPTDRWIQFLNILSAGIEVTDGKLCRKFGI